MMKSKIVLALLLGAAAAVITAKPTSKLWAHKNILKNTLAKRGSTCSAVQCVPEGGYCSGDKSTACVITEKCIDGICTPVKTGSLCEDMFDCLSIDFGCDPTEGRCFVLKNKGETCTGWVCGDGLFCNMTASSGTGVCVNLPEEVGDQCLPVSEFGFDMCPEGTVCSSYACKPYPSVAGADCDTEVGCKGDSLFCSSAGKCVKYPKAGEQCVEGKCARGCFCEGGTCKDYPDEGQSCEGYCAEGFYCNESICASLPSENKACSDDLLCAKGLKCGEYKSSNLCLKSPAGVGEYCISDSSLPIPCGEGLVCDDSINECVVGECAGDLDCKKQNIIVIYTRFILLSLFCLLACLFVLGPSGKGCFNYRCFEFMSFEDGMECPKGELGPFFCKEGRVCGRSSNSSTGGVCMMPSTKLSDNITCNTFADCPPDSECECNDIVGVRQCVPLVFSTKKVLGNMLKALEISLTPYKMSMKAFITYPIMIGKLYLQYDSSFRCAGNYTFPEEPASSSSLTSRLESDSTPGSGSEPTPVPGSMSGSEPTPVPGSMSGSEPSSGSKHEPVPGPESDSEQSLNRSFSVKATVSYAALMAVFAFALF